MGSVGKNKTKQKKRKENESQQKSPEEHKKYKEGSFSGMDRNAAVSRKYSLKWNFCGKEPHINPFFWAHRASTLTLSSPFPFFTPQEHCWRGSVIQLSNQCTHCGVYHPLCTSSPHSITFSVNLPHMPFISFCLPTFLQSRIQDNHLNLLCSIEYNAGSAVILGTQIHFTSLSQLTSSTFFKLGNSWNLIAILFNHTMHEAKHEEVFTCTSLSPFFWLFKYQLAFLHHCLFY